MFCRRRVDIWTLACLASGRRKMTIVCGHWSRKAPPKPEPGPLWGEEMRPSATVPGNLAARFRHGAEPAERCRLRRTVRSNIKRWSWFARNAEPLLHVPLLLWAGRGRPAAFRCSFRDPLGGALFLSKGANLVRRCPTIATFRAADRAKRDAQDLSLGGEPMRISVTILAAAINPDLIRALAD